MAPEARGPKPPNPASNARFYAKHPRALIAKRMMGGLLEAVQSGRRTNYKPIRPDSNYLVPISEEIERETLVKLRAELKRMFWVAYRMDEDDLDLAAWSYCDGDLATLWGLYLAGQQVWKLEAKARASVARDWVFFCKLEGI